MRDEEADRLMRNIAAAALVGPLISKRPHWETFPDFSPAQLPVDPSPWCAGVVHVDVWLSVLDKKEKAPFLFWTQGDDILSVEPIVGDGDAVDVGFALIDAMVAPWVGAPRRPRLVCLADEAMATSLRDPTASEGHDLAAIVDVVVRPTPVDTSERVVTFLENLAKSRQREAGEG